MHFIATPRHHSREMTFLGIAGCGHDMVWRTIFYERGGGVFQSFYCFSTLSFEIRSCSDEENPLLLALLSWLLIASDIIP